MDDLGIPPLMDLPPSPGDCHDLHGKLEQRQRHHGDQRGVGQLLLIGGDKGAAVAARKVFTEEGREKTRKSCGFERSDLSGRAQRGSLSIRELQKNPSVKQFGFHLHLTTETPPTPGRPCIEIATVPQSSRFLCFWDG